jgi:hypothetical protein
MKTKTFCKVIETITTPSGSTQRIKRDHLSVEKAHKLRDKLENGNASADFDPNEIRSYTVVGTV